MRFAIELRDNKGVMILEQIMVAAKVPKIVVLETITASFPIRDVSRFFALATVTEDGSSKVIYVETEPTQLFK